MRFKASIEAFYMSYHPVLPLPLLKFFAVLPDLLAQVWKPWEACQS